MMMIEVMMTLMMIMKRYDDKILPGVAGLWCRPSQCYSICDQVPGSSSDTLTIIVSKCSKR